VRIIFGGGPSPHAKATRRCLSCRHVKLAGGLHVGVSPHDPIRLHITAKEHGRYIALSDCWGKEGPIQARTTNENINRRVHGVPNEELPTVYLEAMKIARDLQVHLSGKQSNEDYDPQQPT
jgi:hypothetical protein